MVLHKNSTNGFLNLLKSVSHKINLICVTVWNEWGEGAYLEPDSVNKFAYSEQIKRIVDEM